MGVPQVLKLSDNEVRDGSDPIHRVPITKMWHIGGGESLRISKLASQELHHICLASAFISFGATEKQVEDDSSLPGRLPQAGW